MGTVTITPAPTAPADFTATLKAGGSLLPSTEYRFVIQADNQSYPWTIDFERTAGSADVIVTTDSVNLTITLAWTLKAGFGIYNIAYSKDGGLNWQAMRAPVNGQSVYTIFCAVQGDCSFDFSSEAEWPTGQMEQSWVVGHSMIDMKANLNWVFPSKKIGYSKVTLSGSWDPAVDIVKVKIKAAFIAAGQSDYFIDFGYGWATTYSIYIDSAASNYVHWLGQVMHLYGGPFQNDSGAFVNWDGVLYINSGRAPDAQLKNLYAPRMSMQYIGMFGHWITYGSTVRVYRSTGFYGYPFKAERDVIYFMEAGLNMDAAQLGSMAFFFAPSATYKTTLKNCITQLIIPYDNSDWSAYGLTAYEFRDNTVGSLYMLLGNKKIDFYDTTWTATVIPTDPDTPGIRWDNYGCWETTFINLFHWVEVTVKDAAGAVIFGAAVVVKSTAGATLFSGTSDVNGKVSGDILCMKINSDAAGASIFDDQNPLEYTVSKAGYQTSVVKHSTKRKTWLTIEMLGIPAFPVEPDVRDGVLYGMAGELEGDLIIPAAGDVRAGTVFDAATVGLLNLPPINKVLAPTSFDQWTKVGTVTEASENDVRDGEKYGAAGVAHEGNLVLPPEADVLLDFPYGSNGTEFEGKFVAVYSKLDLESEVSNSNIDGEITGFTLEGEVVMEG